MGRATLTKCLCLALVACVIAELAGARGWPVGYGYWFHRQARQVVGPSLAGDVLVASIDEETLESVPEPLVFWGPRLAEAIATLRSAGAAVVGVDLLFTASPAGWLASACPTDPGLAGRHDAAFRGELASGDVVLIGRMGAGEAGPVVQEPSAEYLFSLPARQGDLGLGNLTPDPDGVVRRVWPSLADRDGFAWPTFAWVLATRVGGDLPTQRGSDGYLIDFEGPAGSVRQFSLSRLLSDDAVSDPVVAGLAGKVVIIGAGASSGQDFHRTPYGLMSGAEVHANAVQTLLSGNPAREAPGWLRLVFSGLLALSGALVSRRLVPLRGLLALLGLGSASIAVSMALSVSGVFLPLASAHLSLFLVFLATLILEWAPRTNPEP